MGSRIVAIAENPNMPPEWNKMIGIWVSSNLIESLQWF